MMIAKTLVASAVAGMLSSVVGCGGGMSQPAMGGGKSSCGAGGGAAPMSSGKSSCGAAGGGGKASCSANGGGKASCSANGGSQTPKL